MTSKLLTLLYKFPYYSRKRSDRIAHTAHKIKTHSCDNPSCTTLYIILVILDKEEGIYILSNFQGYFPVFWQLKGQTVIDLQIWNNVLQQEELMFLTVLRIKRPAKH